MYMPFNCLFYYSLFYHLSIFSLGWTVFCWGQLYVLFFSLFRHVQHFQIWVLIIFFSPEEVLRRNIYKNILNTRKIIISRFWGFVSLTWVANVIWNGLFSLLNCYTFYFLLLHILMEIWTPLFYWWSLQWVSLLWSSETIKQKIIQRPFFLCLDPEIIFVCLLCF